MLFQTLSVVQLLPVILAAPVPQLNIISTLPLIPKSLGDTVSSLPGVNITNGWIAKTEDSVENSYILVLKDGVSSATVTSFQDKVSKRIGSGLKNKYRFNVGQGGQSFQAVQVKTDKQGLADIAKDPAVAFVELDAFASSGPTEPRLAGSQSMPSEKNSGASDAALVQRPAGGPQTWGLGRISHKKTGPTNYVYDNTACKGTFIYVLDTGIRITHDQFRGSSPSVRRAIHGANFVAGQPNEDENGHGTHCAGTAAGWTTGICRQATVINVKVLGKDGRGAYSGIIAGMQWAANDAIARGAATKSVLSISLGGGYSDSLNAAVQGVINQGIPVVVAAGNANQNVVNTSPASAPNAITVGAIDNNDARAWFSNFGPLVDIFAPGVNIYSAWATSDSDYAWLDGTSQATPHVAGLSAYYMVKEKVSGATAVVNKLIQRSIRNKVTDAQESSNRIAYNNSGQ